MEMMDISQRLHDTSGYGDLSSKSALHASEVDIMDAQRTHTSRERLVPLNENEDLRFGRYISRPMPTKETWRRRLLPTRDIWDPSWNMYAFCMLGIGMAIAHDAFYRSLEGKIVRDDNQIVMLRYGTALAFAAKASLVAAVLSAFREQVWATVRSRFLGIATLDDIFAAPQTPFSLLNWEFLSNAKVVAILALYSWYVTIF